MINTIQNLTLIPSNLDKALNGRSARRVRISLKIVTSSAPSIDEKIPNKATKTIAKSKQLQPHEKYFPGPYAINLRATSAVNTIVKMLSAISRTYLSRGLE